MTAPLLRLEAGQALSRTAWPLILQGWLAVAYHLADSYWVGRLGADALSALGGGAFGVWMIHSVCRLTATGTLARVAQAEGAGERARCGAILTQALWIALLLGVLLAGPARGVLPLYLGVLGLAEGSAELALTDAYLRASLTVAVGLAAQHAALAALAALGWTRTSLALGTLGALVNAVLDPALIWGWGPLPACGIAGAAWATGGTAAVVGLAAVLVLAARGVRPVLAGPGPEALRITRIGAPVAAASVAFCWVYVVLGGVITGFGAVHLAGLGVAQRLEGLLDQVCTGFAAATATLVGQHLGAGDADRAARAARQAARLCLVALLPAAALLFLGAPWLLRAFSDDAAVVAAGVAYLRPQLLTMPLYALEAVFAGAFAGAGHTLPSTWIGFLGTVARIPLAWLLIGVPGLGVRGVWWAIAASSAVKGVLTPWWFRRRTWIGGA